MLGLCTKEFHGPWRIVIGEENDGSVTHSIADSRNHFVCSMDGECPTGDEEQLGNLIAAAPELLEACEAALVALNTATNFRVTITNGLPIKSSYDVAALLGKAVRKAKGESA